MIKKFRAKGFGCLKDVTAHLTPLHAFIGPNDSGKSTLLKAIDTLGRFSAGAFMGDLPHLAYFQESAAVLLSAFGGGSERCMIEGTASELVLTTGPVIEKAPRQKIDGGTRAMYPPPAAIGLQGIRMLRLDPDALRQASPLLRLDNAKGFFEQRGRGLAGLLGTIFIRGEAEPAASIREQLRLLFPAIQRVAPAPVGTQGTQVELEAALNDGTRVLAGEMSEGLLFYLAFFVLQYLENVSILLLEEPENGLHPSRIAKVVQVLRDLTETKGVQVILSTHSPLLINELKPEEVSVVTRAHAEAGTQITPLKETHNFDERSKVLNLGELWLSYANGSDEEALVGSK